MQVKHGLSDPEDLPNGDSVIAPFHERPKRGMTLDSLLPDQPTSNSPHPTSISPHPTSILPQPQFSLPTIAEGSIDNSQLLGLLEEYIFGTPSERSLQNFTLSSQEFVLLKRFLIKKLFLLSSLEVKKKLQKIEIDSFGKEMMLARPYVCFERANVQRRTIFTFFQKYIREKKPSFNKNFTSLGYKNKDSLNHHFYFRFFYYRYFTKFFIETINSSDFIHFFARVCRNRFRKSFGNWISILIEDPIKYSAIHLPPLPFLLDSAIDLFSNFF